jgi:hypothetical protein
MVTRDKDGTKMLVGNADRNSLVNDKAFSWFREGYDKYQSDDKAIKIISQHAGALHIEVFGGTWCSDTHDLLPGFYRAMDAAGVKDTQISLHLVDRDKKTKDGAADRYQITNVPTFIVSRDNKQIGRIVESAKVSVEADIAAMLTKSN